MKITGPFRDLKKKKLGYPRTWYLRVKVPRTTPQGAAELDPKGRPRFRRERPYYETREAAESDIPRLRGQHGAGGVGSTGVLTRARLEDLESARRIVPEEEATQTTLAKFWRLHHPRYAALTIAEHKPKFLEWVKSRVGETRHYEDLNSRLGIFCTAGFGSRLPATVTREEFLSYLLSLGKAGRTVLNQKRAIVNFFNWLVDEAKALPTNQIAGIKKRALPKDTPKEIEFLSLEATNRYLRTLERYDPDLIAHEIIQLVAGVRADDEMEDFRGEFVKAETREVVIPAEIAKTGRREVIDTLEENFWVWWKHYGRTSGLLRPKNYLQRWHRARVLSRFEERSKADALAKTPIKVLLARPEAKAALKAWPWNARRRTFCTYHVAKHQSADKTALILRHRGEASTLHNSYRGTGISQAQGVTYFETMPNPIGAIIRPARPARGIIRIQLNRGSAERLIAAAVA